MARDSGLGRIVKLSKRDVDAADDEDHHDLGATDMAALIQTLMVWRAARRAS